MTADTDQQALFFDLETRLHRRAVRNSPEAVAALLADDFVEFGLSGRVHARPRRSGCSGWTTTTDRSR